MRLPDNRRYSPAEFAHVSSHIVMILAIGVDPAADKAVLTGQLRDAVLVTLPDGTQFRRARTKGSTFAYADRAAHRTEVLAERRAR